MRKYVFLILIQFISISKLNAQEVKCQDVFGLGFESSQFVDSIKKVNNELGIDFQTMFILFTHKLSVKSPIFRDNTILILASNRSDTAKKIIIIKDSKIYLDTMIHFDCWKENELHNLCFDSVELPLGSDNSFFLPEIPSNWSGNSYFSMIHFERNATYYFEVDIFDRQIFNDKPDKKKKREEIARKITNCLVEILEKNN